MKRETNLCEQKDTFVFSQVQRKKHHSIDQKSKLSGSIKHGGGGRGVGSNLQVTDTGPAVLVMGSALLIVNCDMSVLSGLK